MDLVGSPWSLPFTAVIFSGKSEKFKDLQGLKNQDLEISGTITEYHGKLEIGLEGPERIKVVDGKRIGPPTSNTASQTPTRRER